MREDRAMTATGTTVKIEDGSRVELTFGTDYRLRLSHKLGSEELTGRLESRAANGDLVILTDSSGTVRRVKAAKIIEVKDGWGDFDPEAGTEKARTKAHATAKAKVTAALEDTIDYSGAVETVLAHKAAKPSADRAEEIVAYMARNAKSVAHYPDDDFIWKCSTCKRRLRAVECTGLIPGSHPPVAGPAGARAADRKAVVSPFDAARARTLMAEAAADEALGRRG
jgi:hypothetical protein